MNLKDPLQDFVDLPAENTFVDSFGDHSSFLMAAAGAVIGYAMTKDDPAYTCSAQQAVTQANEAAQENQARKTVQQEIM